MNVLPVQTLLLSLASSFLAVSIWQYWYTTYDLFTILEVNDFYTSTSFLSVVLSLWLLNTSRFTLLKLTTVFTNTILWFICSIHIPVSFLQCSTLNKHVSLDYYKNSCSREFSFLMLSWINVSIWSYVLYLYTYRLLQSYNINNTTFKKIIVFYTFIFTYMFLSSDIITDLLIYNGILSESQKRYNVYKLSDNFYILRRFNQIYIDNNQF